MIVKVYEIKSGDIITIYPQGLLNITIEKFIEFANFGIKIIQFSPKGSIYMEKE